MTVVMLMESRSAGGQGLAEMELLSQACRGLPLTLRLVSVALSEGLLGKDVVLEKLSRVNLEDESLVVHM